MDNDLVTEAIGVIECHFTVRLPEQMRDELSEREQKEVIFSMIYAQAFAHGTNGHTDKMLIAKLARLLIDKEVAQ